MKIGVISDTHIPDKCEHIPKTVLNVFKGVDLVIHAGDIVSLKALEELKDVCEKVVVVAGNMDPDEVVRKYPQKQVLDILGLKIGLAHGSGAPVGLVDLLKGIFEKDGCDIIVFGHSHRPMNEKIGKTLFFNPGSATDFISGDTTYGIIEINEKNKNKIEASIIKI
ncbi:MAG: metallophosphoesterase family protein [Candidatus Omnitrophota bacterium]